jgi:predicted MFS family arabinose efflux permease
VLASFAAGAALLALFVHNETRVEEPILPMRLLTNSTRTAANSARGLMYAGMYGMIFFVSQFLQDVQGYSPLKAGVAFLPVPAAVFLASQLTSRVLVRRLPQKTVMLIGLSLAAASLLVATRIGAGTPYWQILASLLLLGAGLGIAFVSLTTASLHDVQAQDAGAASGLINVSQQLGGALGLAVLVSVFGAATSHANLQTSAALGAHATDVLVRGVDDVFWVAALFTLAALAMVAWRIKLEPRPASASAPAPPLEYGEEVAAEGDGEGEADGEPEWQPEYSTAEAC